MRKLVNPYTAMGMLIIALFLSFSRETHAIDDSFVVRLGEENRITKYDIATKQSYEIYQSDKYRVHSLSISPNNKYIAFIEETKPEYGDNKYLVAPKYSLVIIDDSGILISRVDEDVRKYAWSPENNKIAFLTFAPKDIDYGFKFPTGVWIINTATQEKKKITDQAQRISWATYDSAIYLRKGIDVYRYSLVKEKLELTEYKDVNFSQDGRYNLAHLPFAMEPPRTRLYRTDDLTDLSSLLVPFLGKGSTVIKWIKSQRPLLLISVTTYEVSSPTKKTSEGEGLIPKTAVIKSKINYVMDIEANKLIGEFPGSPNQWVGSGETIVVEQDGELLFYEF